MLRYTKHGILSLCALAVAVYAHTSCPHFLVSSPMVVNIEGRFINKKLSRESMDVEWRHHPEALDTFFVNLPDREQIRYITSGESRYMEIGKNKITRRLGTHHLKENLGETPLKLVDSDDRFLRESTKSSHARSQQRNPHFQHRPMESLFGRSSTYTCESFRSKLQRKHLGTFSLPHPSTQGRPVTKQGIHKEAPDSRTIP